jgi:hypothetical protein
MEDRDIRYLPDDYVPSPNDVLCGRGRKCYFHPGNVRFRDIVQSHLAKYSAATSKMEKGNIISIVYEEIQEQGDGGGFIKKDDNGRWYDVGEFLAREKVSQAFRDALHDKYKSSTTSKRKRRELMVMSSELSSQRSLCSYTSASTEPDPSFDGVERTVLPTTSQQEEELVSNNLLDLLDRDLEKVFSSSKDVYHSSDSDISYVHNEDLTQISSHATPSQQQRFIRFDLLHRQQSCPSLERNTNNSSTYEDLMNTKARLPPRLPTKEVLSYASQHQERPQSQQQNQLGTQSSHALGFNRFNTLHKQSSCPAFACQSTSTRSVGASIGVVSDDGDANEDLEPLPCDTVSEIDIYAEHLRAFDAFFQ